MAVAGAFLTLSAHIGVGVILEQAHLLRNDLQLLAQKLFPMRTSALSQTEQVSQSSGRSRKISFTGRSFVSSAFVRFFFRSWAATSVFSVGSSAF